MENPPISRWAVAKLVGSRLVFGIPALLILLFLPAGTLAYWQAWVYLGILLIPMSQIMLYFLKTTPDFLARRMKLKERESEQNIIVRLALIPFLATFILPGLDKRFGWSEVPVFVIIAAEIFVVIGYALVVLVFLENRYASRTIEVHQGQKVIQTGPYRLVRHPMYLGSILMYVATPAALGSYWGMIPAVFIIPVFIARIIFEEKVLVKELAGYTEYQQKTRYRLFPGIW